MFSFSKILGFLLLCFSAVVILPVVVVLFFLGFTGLAAALGTRRLKGGLSPRTAGEPPASSVSWKTAALARAVRLAHGAGRQPSRHRTAEADAV
jgi:hypothetical protein